MKECTPRVSVAILIMLLVVVALAVIPPIEIQGVNLKRVNLLSSFIEIEDSFEARGVELLQSEGDEEILAQEIHQAMAAQQAALKEKQPTKSAQLHDWTISEDSEVVAMRTISSEIEATIDEISATHIQVGVLAPAPVVSSEKKVSKVASKSDITPIEEVAAGGGQTLDRFYDKLTTPGKSVRIAVLGDSFIEGDILTGDLREILQGEYGGEGCGFAPMHSPLTKFRRTVHTTSKGWRTYNIMQYKSAPATDVDLFTISGWVSRPSTGASVEWRGTTAKKGVERSSQVRLLMLSQRDSELSVTVNGEHQHLFHLEGSEELQQIKIKADSIDKVKLDILSGGDGFVGYGAIFEGKSGVCVDNYSVRSNSGQALFWSNPSLNAQLNDAVGGYDLIILQYGLNTMAQNQFNYTAYGKRLSSMVAFVRECFPTADIMIMGVSERYVKQGDKFTPMNSIKHLTDEQRSAAYTSNAAFWETSRAMQQKGGMPNFVANGWAGKDYTHINFNGGRVVAQALADAIISGAESYEQRKIVTQEHTPILKPSERELLYGIGRFKLSQQKK